MRVDCSSIIPILSRPQDQPKHPSQHPHVPLLLKTALLLFTNMNKLNMAQLFKANDIIS